MTSGARKSHYSKGYEVQMFSAVLTYNKPVYDT